jgi:hypothetical protein
VQGDRQLLSNSGIRSGGVDRGVAELAEETETNRRLHNIFAPIADGGSILTKISLLGFSRGRERKAFGFSPERRTTHCGQRTTGALVAAAPLGEMETTVEQTKLDQVLTEIAHAIYSADDWKVTL